MTYDIILNYLILSYLIFMDSDVIVLDEMDGDDEDPYSATSATYF